ncbi:MAG: glycosyltransferase family 9 protein [Candidatus Kryptoniota bacterium]
MDRESLYKEFFHAASLVTEYFPRSGARLLDELTAAVIGGKMLSRSEHFINMHAIKRLSYSTITRILVISDLNIGDAVFSQAVVAGLRDYFPESEIDLVVNRVAAAVIEGNPEVTKLFPVLSGSPYPTSNDSWQIKQLVKKMQFDLVISLSPYFSGHEFQIEGTKVIDFTGLALQVVRDYMAPHRKVHMIYEMHKFVHVLLSDILSPKRRKPFIGVRTTVAESAFQGARKFLHSIGIDEEELLIMYNPDASTRYTQIPFPLQIEILRELSKLSVPILLGAGHSDPNVEKRLLEFLCESERENFFVVPASIPLDVYSVLIDFSAVYISGDAGPLHIAASRKYCRNGNIQFRNSTAVLSVFGATPARIYGYDSELVGYHRANQHAPSHVYVSQSACRNITCINKMAKTCREVRCFDRLDLREIINDVSSILNEYTAFLVNEKSEQPDNSR